MSKEEHNKFIIILSCQLEYFLAHVHLMLQGLIIKPDKKDHQVFNRSYCILSDLPYANDFTNKTDEGELLYGFTFIRYLIRLCNLYILYLLIQLLLFDDDTSSTYKYIKYYLDIAAVCLFIINNILCILLGSQFGQTISGYCLEIIATCHILLVEYYQYQPNIRDIINKLFYLLS